MDLLQPTIVLGLLVGAVQLGLGLLLGMWIVRRRTTGSTSQLRHARDMAHGVADLASSISHDVARYRARMETVSQQLTPDGQTAETASPRLVAQVVKRLTAAIQHLQDRLQTAEHRLEEQARQTGEFLSEARTDALTGLPNRRALDDELTRRVAEWNRRRTPLSLLLVDVDRFKLLNDSHGHLAGDAVLRQLAGCLKRSVRQMDLVSRYGGEEFAIVLPATNAMDATRAAENVRKVIERAEFRHEQTPLQVTASIGVAEIGEGEPAEAMIKRADAALYASKNYGRNCGHWHDGRQCHLIEHEEPAPAANTVLVDACRELATAITGIENPTTSY
jgi:diguanylate cyclase